MRGICAIWHADGWSITNDAVFDEDKHLVEVDGKKMSKNIWTLKLNSIFDVKGKVVESQHVECVFKTESDKKYAFVGEIKSRGKITTIVHNLLKSERYNEILTKLKK